MPLEKHCPECGKALPGNSPAGLCPKCLMQVVVMPQSQETLESSSVPMEEVGSVIGPYKLLERIGEGGMAVVYMAQQEAPFRRRVALKIIKLGMDTQQVVARFEAERQALALMDHPNIARVFDAGTTAAGRSYFVMELVRGVSITEHCDRNRLSTRERLELLIPVCNAVHHAHQKGIVHRDLKPSNILVTLHDGTALPKVIDFGIAKAMNQRLTGQTLFTRYAEMIGTPEYMSPEQAEMSGLEIDTRTDIYSLGVVLYELLTGVLPFDAETLRAAGLGEIQRIIREEEPLRPSTRFSSIGEQAQQIAERRCTDVSALAKCLHRELEWIPLKAMRKERTRRYRSACEFADDLRNYISGAPLIAGPESAAYRVRKVLKKYKMPVLAAAVVLMTLLVGFVVSTYLYLRVHRTQQVVVDLEQAIASDQKLSTAQHLRAEGRYQAALAEIEGYLANEPGDAKAALLHASLLHTLGRLEEAEHELSRLVEGPPATAGPAHYLLATMFASESPDKAKVHRQAGEGLLPQTAEAHSLRGLTASDSQEGIEWLSKALALDPGHYASRKARALALYTARDYRAMALDAEALVAMRARDSFGYALRAIARRELGQWDRALEDHKRAIALCDRRDVLANLHDQRRKTFMRMGDFHAALGDARRCHALDPNETGYGFDAFTALVSRGDFHAAKTHYAHMVGSDPALERAFANWATRFVFSTLAAGLILEIPAAAEGAPFYYMTAAIEQFRALKAKASPLVARAFDLPDWAPDGTQLVYGRTDWYTWPALGQKTGAPVIYGSSGIEILDLKSNTARTLAITGKDPAWSPDGGSIAFTHVKGDRRNKYLCLMPAHGGAAQELTQGDWPSWTDTSDVLYFRRRGWLSCMEAQNPKSIHPLIWCSTGGAAPSPDGRHVAFARCGLAMVAEIATGDVVATWRVPPPYNHIGVNFRWIPGEKEILFAGDNHSDLGLWSYDLERQQMWRLLPAPATLANPSPDRTKLAIALRKKVGGIWMADLDPAVPIYASMAPVLTRDQYLQKQCQDLAVRVRAGTFRADAPDYLRSLILELSELGERYYRHRSFAEALDTLDTLMDLNEALGSEPRARDLAVLAMSLHQLGRDRDAAMTMHQLRELCRYEGPTDQRRVFYEAEKVCADTQTLMGALWARMEAGKLEEAKTQLDAIQSQLPANTASGREVAFARTALAEAFHQRAKGQHITGGTYREALADCATAAELDPNHAQALCDLAWLQAIKPNATESDKTSAIAHVTRACDMTEETDHRCLAALAAVYGQTDDFEAAVKWQQEALRVLRPQEKANWCSDYEARLAGYRLGRAYEDRGNPWSLCSDRLVAWWTLDDMTGHYVRDASGNDCAGRMQRAAHVQPAPGAVGGALFLNDSPVLIEKEHLFDPTDRMTVCAWIKTQAFDKPWQAIVTKGNSAWKLQRQAGVNTLEFLCDGLYSRKHPRFRFLSANAIGQTNVSDGQWHHVAGVYDGQAVRLYVDGELDGYNQTWGSIKTNDFPVVIGGNAESSWREWRGLIDDVRIYRDALEAAHIKALYDKGAPMP